MCVRVYMRVHMAACTAIKVSYVFPSMEKKNGNESI
jgi:hypothetical protein